VPRFSERSKDFLEGCDPRLQEIFEAVVKEVDCTIISGYRGQVEQNELYRTGKSQLNYPHSRHNWAPLDKPCSQAVDAMAYPIAWKDRERATLFAGFVLGLALGMGIELRWGGDWDGDWQVRDNSFDDLAHFELV
jgi:peptidoglycan L-alanyl-D-glutamate endopeptidase CwlK